MKWFKKKHMLDNFVEVRRSYLLELDLRICELENKAYGNRKQSEIEREIIRARIQELKER